MCCQVAFNFILYFNSNCLCVLVACLKHPDLYTICIFMIVSHNYTLPIYTTNLFLVSTLPSDLLMSMLQQVNVTKKLPYLDYHLMVVQQAAEIGIPEDVSNCV